MHLHVPGYDLRLGMALVALLRTIDSPLLGTEWDDSEQ